MPIDPSNPVAQSNSRDGVTTVYPEPRPTRTPKIHADTDDGNTNDPCPVLTLASVCPDAVVQSRTQDGVVVCRTPDAHVRPARHSDPWSSCGTGEEGTRTDTLLLSSVQPPSPQPLKSLSTVGSLVHGLHQKALFFCGSRGGPAMNLVRTPQRRRSHTRQQHQQPSRLHAPLFCQT